MKKHILLSTLLTLMTVATIGAQDIMLLKTSGKVVIGDTSLISTPGPYNLYVQNGILTEKVKVALRDASEWSDDAWEHTPSLTEVATSIEQDRHLPAMPSADQLVADGYEVKDMDAKLLAQVEWLWQHMIELDKENRKLLSELQAIKAKIEQDEDGK